MAISQRSERESIDGVTSHVFTTRGAGGIGCGRNDGDGGPIGYLR
jgi:hypothetical protein